MFTPEKSVLVVVDVQGNLAQKMHHKEELFKNLLSLIQMAKVLNIPIIWTEQVPEKIGKTTPEIAELLSDEKPIEKATFSCWREEAFVRKLKSLYRKQIIIAGIETHVCVYQTVADLKEHGYMVQVVGDAVSSRTRENYEIALRRMETLGALVTSTEMITTELLKTSENEKFRDILALIR